MKKTIYNKKLSLFLIFTITLISALGLASITPALPRIARDLAVAEDKIGLVFSIFALPSLFLTPILGVLADKYGRKIILAPSLFVFSLAGFACFFAPNFTWLLIFRFVQGCGASSLGALNVTLIGDMFEGDERAKIMGYNNGILSVGTAIFPIFGGALAKLGWNFPFLMPLLALPIAILVLARLQNIKSESYSSINEYLKGLKLGFKNLNVIGLLLLSAIAFVLLFGAFLTYTPFIINSKFTNESFQIGLIIASMSIFQALISLSLGKILKYFHKKTLLKFAFICYAFSFALMPLMPNIFWLLIPTLFFGIAHGINIPIVQSLIAGYFPTSQRAFFMSINRMVAQLGQALGPVLMGLILMGYGLDYVFYFGSAIALFTFLMLFTFIKKSDNN